jgi:hypothetical protein
MGEWFVPEGQHDSSQARSAWNHEETDSSTLRHDLLIRRIGRHADTFPPLGLSFHLRSAVNALRIPHAKKFLDQLAARRVLRRRISGPPPVPCGAA